MSDESWELHPKVHPMTVDTFLDVMTDLGSATDRLRDRKWLSDSDGGRRIFQSIVRQMSVPVRKLCLDGNGALLKKTIASPTFYPLGGPKGRYRRATISWRTQRQQLSLGHADGTRQTVVVPETKHEIEIGRLYGVDFLEQGWCTVHSPFDPTARAVPLDTWLEAKALQVNSASYTIEETLRLVADYEGAHTGELPALTAVGVNPENIDRGRNMKYRLANSVYFGCLSYVQIVTLYAAVYIAWQTQQLLAKSSNTLAGLDASSVERLIRHVRTDLVLRAQVANATHPMIVVGKSDVVGSRRRSPVYRFWSGSPQWDGPAPNPQRSDLASGRPA